MNLVSRVYSIVLPDVTLDTAVSPELVLQQVGVVGGGDEVMAQWLAHVLVELLHSWVKNRAFGRDEIHQQAVDRHCLTLLRCATED